MELPTQKDLLRSLHARIALEQGFGVEYATDGAALIRIAARLGTMLPSPAPRPIHPQAVAPASEPVMDQRLSEKGGVHSVDPPVSVMVDVPARPVLPSGYVSLVPYVPPAVNGEKEALLHEDKTRCLACMDCTLCERRTNVAWGEGDLDADIMFIGEGPGRDEDVEGRPFVGRSGRVLTDIIEKGMKLPRNQVYIANMVKCRPPGNRDPRPDEIAACSRYLHKQIAVISPKLIVAVGGVAGCGLLGLPPRTGGLRKKWHTYRGIPLRVIFHPSYLLRQRRTEGERTDADRETWRDIQEIMAKLATL